MALLAVVQMASGSDLQQNMAMACEAIAQAAQMGAQLVAFPEEFATLGLSADQKMRIAEPYQQGPLQAQIAQCAAKHGIWVVAGTLPIKATDHKITASCLVFDAKGNIQARYDKLHLFDVQISETEAYNESNRVQAGNHTTVFDSPVGKMGLSICYDLRFPELYRRMMQQGAEILLVPSAFTQPTGKAHWEILLRARAIENLCYVAAPAEVGKRENGKGTYGHSMIIGPWGECLAQARTDPMVITAEIDLTKMRQIRHDFPALQHCRELLISTPPR